MTTIRAEVVDQMAAAIAKYRCCELCQAEAALDALVDSLAADASGVLSLLALVDERAKP